MAAADTHRAKQRKKVAELRERYAELNSYDNGLVRNDNSTTEPGWVSERSTVTSEHAFKRKKNTKKTFAKSKPKRGAQSPQSVSHAKEKGSKTPNSSPTASEMEGVDHDAKKGSPKGDVGHKKHKGKDKKRGGESPKATSISGRLMDLVSARKAAGKSREPPGLDEATRNTIDYIDRVYARLQNRIAHRGLDLHFVE